jgi:hypothetical protein
MAAAKRNDTARHARVSAERTKEEQEEGKGAIPTAMEGEEE